MSSFMAAFIFSVFGAQPLTIAGVTGVQYLQCSFLPLNSHKSGFQVPLLFSTRQFMVS